MKLLKIRIDIQLVEIIFISYFNTFTKIKIVLIGWKASRIFYWLSIVCRFAKRKIQAKEGWRNQIFRARSSFVKIITLFSNFLIEGYFLVIEIFNHSLHHLYNLFASYKFLIDDLFLVVGRFIHSFYPLYLFYL